MTCLIFWAMGNVGQRPHRDQGDVPVRLHQRVDQPEHRVLGLGMDGGGGKFHIIAVNVVGIHLPRGGDTVPAPRCQGGHHGQAATTVHGDAVLQAQVFHHTQGVLGGEVDATVAVHRAYAQQFHVRRQRRQHDRHGVVGAGVHVQDDFFLFHGFAPPLFSVVLFLFGHLAAVDVQGHQHRQIRQHVCELVGDVDLL